MVISRIAADQMLMADLRRTFARSGLSDAVAQRDTPVLFDWLSRIVSLQGVSDAIAWDYMDRHGAEAFRDIEAVLDVGPSCPKLQNYWPSMALQIHRWLPARIKSGESKASYLVTAGEGSRT
jgi:hypothetical protein